ncbi:MAG: helix-turn-helix domain-containing protein [Lachnospiraceae bacterium]|nr:helix-turn-helix domain-containing protein [Lachnospiraceae bacterium]
MDIVMIGQNIARLRRMNNLTQEKLAEALKVSAPAVSRWENGRSLPDISLLPELATIFDCTIDHLLMAERKQDMICSVSQSTLEDIPVLSLAEQIINIMEGKNMIGMTNQSIMNAFSEKHGHLGDVSVIRNRSTRSEKNIINSITLKVNGREYHLLEKLLFGDMTELYRTKLLCDFGISIPIVYKIDFKEKNILLEDLSEDYICGREFDDDTSNGKIYREAYSDIISAAAQFHLSFWDNGNAFQQIGLPWHLQNEQNFRIHIEGMRHDLNTFLQLFPDKLSSQEIQCYTDALKLLEKDMPDVIKDRFHKGKNITIIQGDLNPSNVFVFKADHSNVKFIDMEAVRMGLPTEDLAMFLALHVEPGQDAIEYLKKYYVEISKKVKDYSIRDFLNDYMEAIMMTMFHPIGVVGVRMKIYDERMIKCAIKAYEVFVKNINLVYEMLEK